MKSVLVTGGAGFIGSNFIQYILDELDNVQLINLDCLTYAGNLENLSDYETDLRYHFVKGDVQDRALLNSYSSSTILTLLFILLQKVM